MPRASAIAGQTGSDGKKQLSIAQFLKSRPSSDAAHSPKRNGSVNSSPLARSSPRNLPPPTSPRASSLLQSPRAQSSPGLTRQSSSSDTSGPRLPRTLNVEQEGPPPQLSPRRTASAGSSSARSQPRKNTFQSPSHTDDKVRTPKGRPLDHNLQMILVREVSECAVVPQLSLTPCRTQFLN